MGSTQHLPLSTACWLHHDPGLTRSRAALHLALLFQDSGFLVPPRTHVTEPARFPQAHGQPGLSVPHRLTHSDRAHSVSNTQQLPSSHARAPVCRPGPSALSVGTTRSITATRIEIPFLLRPSGKTPGHSFLPQLRVGGAGRGLLPPGT